MKKITLLLIAAMLLICGSMQGKLKVGDLRVEHMQNPLIDQPTGFRFSWTNEAPAGLRGQRQMAYRIVVSRSREALQKGKYDLWDSGKCLSDESNLISYAGPALESAHTYWWRVQTWDQADKASGWSQTASFCMGIPSSDWKAQWIGAEMPGHQAPLLRRLFNLNRKVKQAQVFICGLGYFELYMNGQRVGDDYLVPNMTNFTKRNDLLKYPIAIDDDFTAYRVLYLHYDLTPYLRAGSNMAGVILGGGFYDVDNGTNVSPFGKPCLRCQLLIDYTDGTQETILSDDKWQAHPSAITYNGIYSGEVYNANLETADWCTAGSSQQGWQSVSVVQGPVDQMTAQTSPADKITETLKPLSLKKLDEKTYEVDFGKEISGWIHFHGIKGQKGDTLRVKYVCESRVGSQTYVMKGAASEDYAPRFTWFAFSKAHITGVQNLTPQMLTAEAVNTDVRLDAKFETSDTLFSNG